MDTDCDKPRQSSRLVVGVEIQTSCNFEASLFDHYHYLDYVHCLGVSNISLLEFPYLVVVCYHSCFTGCSNLYLLSLKDFLHPPSSSTSSTRPCSTTEPNKSTEHSAIQKGSVHCTVVAVHVIGLLSTVCNSDNFTSSNWVIFISFRSRNGLFAYFSIFKLVIKPDSLLLEDRGSQTSNQGRNQTSTLLLIEIALVETKSSLSAYQGKKQKL